ncbi:MAG: FxLYD domain-containing protein [bacterium]
MIGVIIFLIVVFVLPLGYHYYKPATCFDKVQNQSEQGVDCGGPCQALCPAQYADLNVKWARLSKVDDGVYNVLAYVENPNLQAGVSQIKYVFKLYDKDGVLLSERYGSTFIPANKITAIFEGEMRTGTKIGTRVGFDILSQTGWVKETAAENDLTQSGVEMLTADTRPRVEATVANTSIKEIKNVEAVAIVYDIEGNTLAFSRTIIDSLPANSSQQITYTWPKPLERDYATIEIVLRILK